MLMEGADPLRDEADVDWFCQLGVRIVGLAWKRTRHAGGTGAPGPLTDEGRRMVKLLDRHRIIHDTSHLAEESFWNLLEMTDGPVMASHSNCRAFNPTDRQLSDEMIKALVSRDAVVGMNFYDKFLVPPEEFRKRKANLHDLLKHMRHVCEIAGDAKHVAIGTDMDGGFGREEIPQEISNAGDMPRVGEFLRENGFGKEDVEGIMGGNWVRFFKRILRSEDGVLKDILRRGGQCPPYLVTQHAATWPGSACFCSRGGASIWHFRRTRNGLAGGIDFDGVGGVGFGGGLAR